MNTLKLIVTASLAVATAGCVESMDGYGPSGGGYGYADNGYSAQSGYYAPSTYYRPSYYAPTYAAPRTEVIREVRTVPVPVPVQQARVPREQWSSHPADRSDGRWTGGSRPNEHAGAPSPPAPNSSDHGNRGPQQGQHGHGPDRDGDGRPDRHG